MATWAPVRAQDAPDLEAIRRENFSSAIDRERVTRWVGQRFDALASSEEPLQAGGDFHRSMMEHFRASDASRGFKDGLAEIVTKAFVDRYKPAASEAKPLPPVFALTVLAAYDRESTVPAFQAALQDVTPGVRLAAANGLLKLRAGSPDWTALVPVIQQAATQETDPVVLDRLCHILTRTGGPPPDAVLAALRAILAARVPRFEQAKEFPSLADARMLTWLTGRFAAINDNTVQNDVIRLTARVMAAAVESYLKLKPVPTAMAVGSTDQPAAIAEQLLKFRERLGDRGDALDKIVIENDDKFRDLREKVETFFEKVREILGPDLEQAHRLERVIHASETALRGMVTRKTSNATLPSVSNAMFRGGTERVENVRLELDKWIGTADTAGTLNGAPFNFERGLGIQRAATEPGS